MYNVHNIDDIFFNDIELYQLKSFEKQDSYFYKGVSIICIITLIYLTFLFLRANKLNNNRFDALNNNEEV